MGRSFLKALYKAFPFSIKVFFLDLYLYLRSNLTGGANIKKIKSENKQKKVAVLGNGPSLKIDKNCLIDLVEEFDFVCVNNFCDDELYERIKPKIYLFLDAYFFSEKSHPDWVIRRKKTFKKIDETTTWPMKIVLPHSADENILKQNINNKNVEIIKINTQGRRFDRYNKFVELLFDSGIYGPPQINVLIYAIYVSIICRYKEIHIYGADLSFHMDVNVNQEDNDLFIKFRHFNEADKVESLRKNPEKIDKWSMAELLKLSSDTFYAHEIMNGYARAKGVKIINCSSFSMIDAYPRLRVQ